VQITRDNLKDFQLRAAGELSQMLATYPSPPFRKQFDPDTGALLPFLCRLRAITGSGKTPMLALCASNLGNAIVLWTTNRGAIISQTADNLSAGGNYSSLLPEDAQILELSNLSTLDWNEVCSVKAGLTIILSTVALFNREGDALNVHKDRGDTSYWQMLSGRGSEGRHRDLYIVYDEAHGGTKAQFSRLTELKPRAFILASASELPEGLSELLPGKTSEEKTEALKAQTTIVPTPKVVEAGLLKTRLYLVDCNTTRLDALKEANDKWFELSRKLQPLNEQPIICCIVNSTLAGLEVWDSLTQELGVDPNRVAVHLANVDRAMAEANPNAPWGRLIDTHKAKKTPEALRNEGYTHLIWNLSLREGWDEPWAYVAYLDGMGKSLTDISQKIGRFLRQPNAIPFEDGDLNSAYFYFNVADDEFADVVRNTQSELANQGYEIISISSGTPRSNPSRESPVKRKVNIAKVAESFGEDLNVLDEILLSNVPSFAPDALHAPGSVSTRVIDLRHNEEDDSLRKEEQREDNAEIRVWDYLIARLAALDSRVAKKNGSCFTSFVKEDPRLRQKMQAGSPAMTILNGNLSKIKKQLNDEFRLEYEPDQEYEVKSFNLVSPDLQTDDLAKRERYRVRHYKNALHPEYNGMNSFEVKLADALDTLGLDWCRNPSKTGYGIPIPEIGEGTTNFYPDFLLWSKGKKCLWAIDPKGAHLLNDAIRTKLMGISDVDDLPLKVRVAFIVEGEYEIGADKRPQQRGKDGCTLIFQQNAIIKAKHFLTVASLVADLK
jgi:superfamily II DNA or RNA helicase